jgi:DNA-binding transcriptional LysR family regulator
MALRHLDFASLALFRAVCASGSITDGALAYGLALGAASRRIAELERRLGARLLVRGRAGVRPTAAGTTLLDHVEQLAREADRLELSLEDHRMGIDTRVRVWANTSAVNGFLPERIVAFARRSPDIRIDLDEEFSDAIVRAVADGRAEIGVLAETTPAWSLHTAACDTHRLVAIALRTHPLARRRRLRFEELLEHDFVGLTRGTALQTQLEMEAAALNRPLRLRVQVRSYDAVCKLVSVGLGISVVPEQVAQLMAPPLGLAVARLDEPWATRRRVVEQLSPAARAFFEMLTGGRHTPERGDG